MGGGIDLLWSLAPNGEWLEQGSHNAQIHYTGGRLTGSVWSFYAAATGLLKVGAYQGPSQKSCYHGRISPQRDRDQGNRSTLKCSSGSRLEPFTAIAPLVRDDTVTVIL